MQTPWNLRPLSQRTVVLLTVLFVRTVCASSDSYLVVFQTNNARYEFEMLSLEIQGIQQRKFLSQDFKHQFKTVSDLTREGIQSFLKRFPENRDAMVIYLLKLPDYLIRDTHRLRLLRTIERFRLRSTQREDIQVIGFDTTQLGRDDKSLSNTSLFKTSPTPMRATIREQSVIPNSLLQPSRRRKQGFDFRFYRGLLVEYQFEAPALLRFDVRRQRFELQWGFD